MTSNEPISTQRNANSNAPCPAGGPRIYVACLAAYNNHRLHGRWIEVSDIDQIWQDVRAMLAQSPEPNAEEWAIHDYDGFYGCHISEHAGFETICDVADFLAEHGELGAKLLGQFCNDLEQARAAFDDYAGEYKSAADFASQLHDDIGTDIPEILQYYID